MRKPPAALPNACAVDLADLAAAAEQVDAERPRVVVLGLRRPRSGSARRAADRPAGSARPAGRRGAGRVDRARVAARRPFGSGGGTSPPVFAFGSGGGRSDRRRRRRPACRSMPCAFASSWMRCASLAILSLSLSSRVAPCRRCRRALHAVIASPNLPSWIQRRAQVEEVLGLGHARDRVAELRDRVGVACRRTSAPCPLRSRLFAISACVCAYAALADASDRATAMQR